jgi:hypothetical protein
MNLPEAMTTLAQAEMSADAADAVITVLAELRRLRALEIDLARRVQPDTVVHFGALPTIAYIRQALPHLAGSGPTRRGESS